MRIERKLNSAREHLWKVVTPPGELTGLLMQISAGLLVVFLISRSNDESGIPNPILFLAGAGCCALWAYRVYRTLRSWGAQLYPCTVVMEGSDAGLALHISGVIATTLPKANMVSYHDNGRIVTIACRWANVEIKLATLSVEEQAALREWLAKHLTAGPLRPLPALPGLALVVVGVIMMHLSITGMHDFTRRSKAVLTPPDAAFGRPMPSVTGEFLLARGDAGSVQTVRGLTVALETFSETAVVFRCAGVSKGMEMRYFPLDEDFDPATELLALRYGNDDNDSQVRYEVLGIKDIMPPYLLLRFISSGRVQ